MNYEHLFYRTPFLQNTSGGCFCKDMEFQTDAQNIFFLEFDAEDIIAYA